MHYYIHKVGLCFFFDELQYYINKTQGKILALIYIYVCYLLIPGGALNIERYVGYYLMISDVCH